MNLSKLETMFFIRKDLRQIVSGMKSFLDGPCGVASDSDERISIPSFRSRER